MRTYQILKSWAWPVSKGLSFDCPTGAVESAPKISDQGKIQRSAPATIIYKKPEINPCRQSLIMIVSCPPTNVMKMAMEMKQAMRMTKVGSVNPRSDTDWGRPQ